MGGMQALLLAAKYPHVFAAAMAGQPPTDFSIWGKENQALSDVMLKELGGTRQERPFEYARREPVTYARNLRYTPTLIWNGTLDRVVTPEHAKRMVELMQKHNPYQQPVFWLEGAGHNPINYGAEWIYEKLRWYQRTRDRFYSDLDFVLDESGQFFWVTLEQKDGGNFSEVTTELKGAALEVRCTNVSRLKLDLKSFGDRTPKSVVLQPDAAVQVQVLGGKAGQLERQISEKSAIQVE
jgi:hypothetical protein